MNMIISTYSCITAPRPCFLVCPSRALLVLDDGRSPTWRSRISYSCILFPYTKRKSFTRGGRESHGRQGGCLTAANSLQQWHHAHSSTNGWGVRYMYRKYTVARPSRVGVVRAHWVLYMTQCGCTNTERGRRSDRPRTWNSRVFDRSCTSTH